MTRRSKHGGPTISLGDFITAAEVRRLIAVAKREDLGPRGIDITSRSLVPAKQNCRAQMRARRAGRLSGAALLPIVAAAYGRDITVAPHACDGQPLASGQIIADITGRLRSVLAMERVALNFVTHLSGIATLTDRYVDAVAGTKAVIVDTRKTHVGLRGLEKYAVVCGGGVNHRIGLYDAVLVKDNHIAHLTLEELPAMLGGMIRRVRASKPAPAFIEIEVDTLEQLKRVLPCLPDIVLLDNMNAGQVRRAVVLRDRVAPAVLLEASGGVNLDNVRQLAEAGVDRIAIGAITHSAPALDVGLDIA